MVCVTNLKVILSIDVRLGQFILYLQSSISNLHHTELTSFPLFAVLLMWNSIVLLLPGWAGHTPGPTCTSGKRFSTLHRSGTPWVQGNEKTSKNKPNKKMCCGVNLSDKQVKHCQRHNGPEGWVLVTKVNSLGHITSSQTILPTKQQLQNLNPISAFWLNLTFKILTKPSFRIFTKNNLHNLSQGSAAKYWLNLSFKIVPEPQSWPNIVLKVWTKSWFYDWTSSSKSASNYRQHVS